MIEPITNKTIIVYDLRLLGGDEPPVAFVAKCIPDDTILQLHSVANMVFLFKHYEELINEMVTGMVKVAPGSKFIPLEDINDGYSGLVLQKVDALTFIELKETVNVEAFKEVPINSIQSAQE